MIGVGPPEGVFFGNEAYDMYVRYRSSHQRGGFEEVRLCCVFDIFMCGTASKMKAIPDQAAPHRRQSSSSGLFRNEDCFTTPHERSR